MEQETNKFIDFMVSIMEKLLLENTSKTHEY